MAFELVGVGAAPNDGTGDAFQTAFSKINNNFVSGVQVVKHGADGTVARPNVAKVDWMGSVEPLNKVVGDTWFVTSEYDGGA